MRQGRSILLPLLLLAGCGDQGETGPSTSAPDPAANQVVRPGSVPTPASSPATPGAAKQTLTEARRGFNTKPVPRPAANPAPEPPSNIFSLVRYDSPVGKLAAYVSPDPGDAQKHLAIVWITGGDCNTIDELWKDAPRDNDQTASAYRKAGILMMFPSLRGGNDNPGQREGFFGEVDDVLAATDYLAHQDYVDPKRIYLGGHSTGGTLVMLVAESSDRFRAVFSFGPAANVAGYGPEYLPFDTSNPKEIELRSPGFWLDSVKSPLFVFEGTEDSSNIDSLRAMAGLSKNPLSHFFPVKGVSHFSILAPTNELIAAKILKDDGPTLNIEFSEQELDAISKQPSAPQTVRRAPSPGMRPPLNQRPGTGRTRMPLRGRR